MIVSTLLTTVDQPGALEAYIYVPADRGSALRLGLPVELLDDNGAVVATSKITFISPEVDTETQTVLAKSAVENPEAKLRIAQQVRARVIWGTHAGPVIPVLAVTRINGQFFAFLAVNEGKGTIARQKLLKVGDTIGNDYVVIDGLKPGDHVIVSGTDFLQDGTPVAEQIQSQPRRTSRRERRNEFRKGGSAPCSLIFSFKDRSLPRFVHSSSCWRARSASRHCL